MGNIMVCVTTQRTCDRLIRYGYDCVEKSGGELFIIHVAPYEFKFLNGDKDGEALEYLYERAIAYGANLTVVRSNNVIDTLVDLVEKNNIYKLVVGEAKEEKEEGHSQNGFLDSLEDRVRGRAELFVVPALS